MLVTSIEYRINRDNVKNVRVEYQQLALKEVAVCRMPQVSGFVVWSKESLFADVKWYAGFLIAIHGHWAREIINRGRRVNGYLIKVGPSSWNLLSDVGVRGPCSLHWKESEIEEREGIGCARQGRVNVLRELGTRRVEPEGCANFRAVCSRRCQEELCRSELRRRARLYRRCLPPDISGGMVWTSAHIVLPTLSHGGARG